MKPIPILLAFFVMAPFAQAGPYLVMNDPDGMTNVAVPSGEYQDGHTLAVYQYDSATDTLLPVGVAANREGFYEIDVVGPGERPATGHGTCGSDAKFCVAALAAAANPNQELRWIAINVTTSCDPPYEGQNKSFSGFAYPYDRYPWFPSNCPTPSVTASIKLDGVVMVTDTWPN